MANEYIDFLVKVMESYDAANGLSHTEEQYKMLAWAGLDNTPQFEQSGLNTVSWYNNIKSLINQKPCLD